MREISAAMSVFIIFIKPYFVRLYFRLPTAKTYLHGVSVISDISSIRKETLFFSLSSKTPLSEISAVQNGRARTENRYAHTPTNTADITRKTVRFAKSPFKIRVGIATTDIKNNSTKNKTEKPV